MSCNFKDVRPFKTEPQAYIINAANRAVFTVISPSGCHCVRILVAKRTYKQNLKYRKTVLKYCLPPLNSCLNVLFFSYSLAQVHGRSVPEDGAHDQPKKFLKLIL